MDIDKIINEVEAMHPYKKAGDRDSYSQYAEGWSDACDILREHIKQYLCEGNQTNSENANCAIFDVIGSLPQEIRDEMDSDMEDSGMAQGEIESCLNHWNNKYVISRIKL